MNAPTDSFVARSAIRAVVRDEIKKYVDDFLAGVIGEAIGRMMREVEQIILEQTAFAYKGNFQEALRYKRGNFVSMGGQLYHANRDTTSRPGTDDTWTLAVRSGRDGRDGRDGKDTAQSTPPPAPRTVRSHG
jgi:hypothetical protein